MPSHCSINPKDSFQLVQVTIILWRFTAECHVIVNERNSTHSPNTNCIFAWGQAASMRPRLLSSIRYSGTNSESYLPKFPCCVLCHFIFFEHKEGSCISHTTLKTKRPSFLPWNKNEVNGWFRKILPLERSGESQEQRQWHI